MTRSGCFSLIAALAVMLFLYLLLFRWLYPA